MQLLLQPGLLSRRLKDSMRKTNITRKLGMGVRAGMHARPRLFLEICLTGLLADNPRHGTVWASICNLRNVWPAALQPASQTPVECKFSCRVMCSSVAHSINQFVIMRPRPEPTLCFGQLPGAAHNFCICLHCFRCQHFSLPPLSYVRCAWFFARLRISCSKVTFEVYHVLPGMALPSHYMVQKFQGGPFY